MKDAKIYVVTYKRPKALNQTLENIFDSDFGKEKNVEVTVINNHSDFHLNKVFRDRVHVIHHQGRPDWSNGHLTENWNQAILHGFKDLSKPDSKYVIGMQNDAVLDPDWFANLMKMHESFDFVAGRFGDNVVSYTPDSVKKIGLWDERLCGIQHQEADYWLRALVFNKSKSCINDTLHGRTLNAAKALPLDITEGRNFRKEGGVLKRRADDAEHQKIWDSSRGGYLAAYLLKFFCQKWEGTWETTPQRNGWIINWGKEFTKNPPKAPKPMYMRYPYFERHIDQRHYAVKI